MLAEGEKKSTHVSFRRPESPVRPSLPRPRTPVVDELMRRALSPGAEAVVPLGGLVAER